MKSLFILFSGDFVEDAAGLLAKYNTIADDATVLRAIGEEKAALLVDSVVDTLYHIFLYDTQSFVNLHRFQLLLEPLVDQIDNDIVLTRPKSQDQLTLCLAQLGVAANDDIMWKQLNHAILLKTRNVRSDSRYGAATEANLKQQTIISLFILTDCSHCAFALRWHPGWARTTYHYCPKLCRSSPNCSKTRTPWWRNNAVKVCRNWSAFWTNRCRNIFNSTYKAM